MPLRELKVVLIGSHAVGKTSIVRRSTGSPFEDATAPTLGGAYKSRVVRVDNIEYRLQIWDTAGQERYRGLTPIYYRQASVAIVVYSIADRHSFDEIEEWKRSLDNHANKGTRVILVGNKMDLEDEREVRFEEGERRASAIEAVFFEVSAKTGFGIEDIFEQAARLALETEITFSTISVEPKPEGQSCGC